MGDVKEWEDTKDPESEDMLENGESSDNAVKTTANEQPQKVTVPQEDALDTVDFESGAPPPILEEESLLPARSKMSRILKTLVVASLLLLAFSAAGLFAGKDWIQEHFTQMRPLYQALNLEKPPSPFRLEKVTVTSLLKGHVVKGTVRNGSSQGQTIEHLEIQALSDCQKVGRILREKSFLARMSSRLRFQTIAGKRLCPVGTWEVEFNTLPYVDPQKTLPFNLGPFQLPKGTSKLKMVLK